ncbi:MAG: hypothetical protein ACLFMS_08215 [Halorhodospira sp.]
MLAREDMRSPIGLMVLGLLFSGSPLAAESSGEAEAEAASEQDAASDEEVPEALVEAHERHEAGDLEAAHEAFAELAEEGNTEAKVQLGWMYLEGHATEPDMARAAELWQEAADAGHERAEQLLEAVQPGVEAQ